MTYAIETINLTKHFGALRANDSISLKIKEGTIHSICGENGAGKSTLMNMLYGLLIPTAGSIKVFGQEVKFQTSLDAIEQKIGMVHQHFMLIQNLSVAENIVLGMETGHKWKLDRKQAVKDVEKLMDQYKLKVDPNARIDEISVGMQQRVEILKALYRGIDILILDEPTAVLAPQEIKELFDSIRFLISQGKTVIMISHKLNEVLEVSDEVSVLRLGKFIGTISRKEASKERITQMMVGREVHLGGASRQRVKDKKDALVIDSVDFVKNDRTLLNNVSMTVQTGEIVGIAGIDGNGQTELIKLIGGTLKPTNGTIQINQTDTTKKSVREMKNLGMGFIPEDRHHEGLVLDFTIAQNMVLGDHYKEPFAKKQFMQFDQIEQYTKDNIQKFDIRTEHTKTKARSLSGGNQQKIILAREMVKKPTLIIASQPTRGLDIGAIEYVHNTLVEARNNNQAVLVVSFELEELIALSDRILVMYDGQIVGEQHKGHFNINELGRMMLGLAGDHNEKN